MVYFQKKMENQTLESLMGQARKRIETLDRFLSSTALPKSCAAPDHIGYKCASQQEYDAIKSLLMPGSGAAAVCWMYESVISNRRIAYVRFRDEYVLTAQCGPIAYMEIQDQKPDNTQVAGFDHIEVVLKTGKEADNFLYLIKTRGYKVAENIKTHHATKDIILDIDNRQFIIKISSIPLVAKIKNEEMK